MFNSMSSSSLFLSSSSSSSSNSPNLNSEGYIQHAVTKFDTLAGVAVKYGVEVADIKKMNGLVTDHQMFALRFLHIPLPGKHPPSPCLSNGSNTPRSQSCSDRSFCISPQRKASQAMDSLQSYYGLKANQNSIKREILEMVVYRNRGSHYLEDIPFLGASSASQQQLSHSRKSRSLVKLDENSELSDPSRTEGDSDQLGEKRIRRRQKSEAEFSRTPEMLLEDNAASGGFSATPITGKRLALRLKAAANRADVEIGGSNPMPAGLGDSLLTSDGLSGLRKSSSTSNMQDHDAPSIWSSSKWSLKPDLQSFSTSAITKPVFDGLPKPMVGRRNKAALD